MNENPAQPEPHTTSDIDTALQQLAKQLRGIAAENPQIRTLLTTLGQTLIAIAAPTVMQGDSAHDQQNALPPIEQDVPAPQQRPTPPTPILPRLPVIARAPEPIADEELAQITAQCLLKAEAARWSIERSQQPGTEQPFNTTVEARDQEFINRSRSFPFCHLWMLRRDTLAEDEITRYSLLGGSFEAVAAAATLLDELISTHDGATQVMEQALRFAAEAQSALRVIAYPNTDRDQVRLFYWVKERCIKQGIFLHQYMRIDHTADPANWFTLRTQINTLTERSRSSREQRQRERRHFNTIRYHLKLIGDHAGMDRLHDWNKITNLVGELIDGGMPPTNRELRELLLPFMDAVPDTITMSAPAKRMFDQTAAFRATSLQEETWQDDGEMESADLVRARMLLRGQAVVFIGGDRRREVEEQLCQALALKELIWIETRAHQTHMVFESYVARLDVAVVLLAIRWSSHSFSEVQTFCTQHDKPLVRLPAGYNPNQVAYQIMAQASEYLATKTQV